MSPRFRNAISGVYVNVDEVTAENLSRTIWLDPEAAEAPMVEPEPEEDSGQEPTPGPEPEIEPEASEPEKPARRTRNSS